MKILTPSQFGKARERWEMTITVVSPRQATIGMIVVALKLKFLATVLLAGPGPITLPGCPETCGDVRVPYPFGIGQGCFHHGFNLTCDEEQHPPRLFLGDGVEVLGISLPDGTVRIRMNISWLDHAEFNGSWSVPAPAAGPLRVSSARNSFVAFGCNMVAKLIPYSALGGPTAQSSVCAAVCSETLSAASCSGVGCCRTSIAFWGDLPSYGVQVKHLVGQPDSARVLSVFVVDQDWFSRNEAEMASNYSKLYYEYENVVMADSVPAVLEWSLDILRDEALFVLSPIGPGSSDFRCLSSNGFSYTIDGNYDRRRCNCSDGYEGNPYVSDGCQDLYPCHGTCINLPGTHRCSPKKSIWSLPGLITIIAISSGFGLLFSLLGVAKITKKLKQQRAKKLRQFFFKRNHGLLLQQLISSNKDIAERMKIFSVEELEQATNKFDQNRILGRGGHGTVYKGILSDQRVVAIKKSKIVVQREIDQFINEVVILSQTNHRNVVKLFGCCLETEVPLLVYEFISNGTLSYHLHEQSENPLPWKDRLRIALETAKAIAYLHSAASISVFHRDIKSANILLTDNLTAKVSDFGASRSISIDETGILTAIQGTHGYLDPEYYYTSRLTEKSDVYSFGVILAELLTKVAPVFSSHSSEVTSLASHFVSLKRDNRLWDVLDPQIIEEGGAEDAEVIANIAETCLSLKGEERPTMRQVETKLEDVQGSKVHPNSRITRTSQNAPQDKSFKGNRGSEGTRQYSLEKEFIQSSEIPR
ncbi:wall-associated receptor kinase 1 isoform X2 [Setaria viridis]|uniref:wall-associated receptor kinase 1 isoform X2 n=1 Tax=Setaria viridis TaxID=4556 RepID=UPI0014934601|nr:wall-associated receptor kinase 1-like isoform X2 [Setaria viridis]